MPDSAGREPLRIGIDACCWIHPRGYGRYTRELITAMVAAAPNDRFVLFADAAANVGIGLDAPNVERVVVDQSVSPTRAAATSNSRSLADIFRLYRAVSRERPDVFLIPSVYLSIPVPARVPSVVIVHDAIAERFPELTLPGRRDRLFWRAKVALALRQARRVLTVSEFSALELERYLGIERSRMRVTSEAPAPVYRPSSPEEIATAAARHGMDPKDRWLIYVGGVNPHKNLTSLVEAFSGVREALGDDAPYLFLVGPGGRDGFHDEVAEVQRAIAGANLSHAVKWPGFVDDEELRHLYSGATALVLPSLAEGFGLPAVEAAACGTPVVATTQSPLPQLLEGGGFFVDPHDVGAITGSLLALLNDPSLRMRMGACAARRAGRLSWTHAATVALETCREAAATKRPQPYGGSVYAGARHQ